ncbi:ice-binding family protein [Pontibacter sp. MBLB2868]|uniref:ice-binding family protein n=1 Tax=Pontibacter sp. MBLB2868 TaxID=3451555 RepID=UPI003F74FB26
MKLKKLVTTLALASVVVIAGCKEDTFIEEFGVCPVVLSTTPENGATPVSLTSHVTVTFNEAMNPETITQTSFSLTGPEKVPGAISYDIKTNTLTFVPENELEYATTYTGRVATSVKDVMGNALQTEYVWTFTTISPSTPRVVLTNPVNLATGVARNIVISAGFSEAMIPSTFTATSFTLKTGTTTIAGNISYTGTTAKFTTENDLAANTTYTATITTDAKSTNNAPLAGNYEWTFTTGINNTQPGSPGMGVDLKSVGRFGIFAGVGISNNAGFSEIRNLDVGITPGVRSSVTGFPPAIVVNGAIYASDDSAPAGTSAMLLQAKQDLLEAYLFAEGASSPAPATVAGDQGGKTLAPGIYKSTSTLLVQAGDLTLDAKGDPNAVWIFQIASDFTTVGGAGGNIILTGGAQAKNIFWQTGSSATIGDGTSFKGNVLALTSITLNSGAKATGRMLARNGSVVMTNTNIIEKP